MRVVIDTSALGLNVAGTSTYIRQLCRALQRPDSGVELQCASYRPLFDRGHRVLRAIDTVLREFWWVPRRLPTIAARAHADILHAPAFQAPSRSRVPTVVTVYDLYPMRNPAAFTRWQRHSIPAQLRRSVRCAGAVVAISEFTRSEIAALFPEIDPARVTVTPLAPGDHFRPVNGSDALAVRAKHGLEQPYVLGVCTMEPRKNMPGLLKAFAVCSTRVEHLLALAGPYGWRSASVPRIVEDLGLGNRVRLLGYVDDADLPALYCSADAFVYPSLYEGFGLPPLEAMACGCPVVTSRVASLPEVTGDAAVLVDPLSTQSIAEGLRGVLTNANLREDLRRRGLMRAASFSWDRCASATIAAYRQALAHPRSFGGAL